MSMKVNIPYLASSTSKSGKRYYYYRRAGAKIALKDADGKTITKPSGKVFRQAYQAAESAWESRQPHRINAPGTLGALIIDYQNSPAFARLAASTRKNAHFELNYLNSKFGAVEASAFTPAHIAHLQDRLSNTPRQADLYVSRLRALFDLAVRQGLIRVNPASGIKPQHKSTPHATWPEGDIQKIITHARPDIARAVLWLWRTGLRVSDCLSIQREDIKGNTLYLKESKTGTRLAIPLHPDLRSDLTKGATPLRHILTNSKGQAWTRSGFRVSFKKEVDRLAIKWRPIHGLRRAAITSLIEAGCTPAEVSAITGQTMQMVEHYATDRNREKLARQAMNKWEK